MFLRPKSRLRARAAFTVKNQCPRASPSPRAGETPSFHDVKKQRPGAVIRTRRVATTAPTHNFYTRKK